MRFVSIERTEEDDDDFKILLRQFTNIESSSFCFCHPVFQTFFTGRQSQNIPLNFSQYVHSFAYPLSFTLSHIGPLSLLTPHFSVHLGPSRHAPGFLPLHTTPDCQPLPGYLPPTPPIMTLLPFNCKFIPLDPSHPTSAQESFPFDGTRLARHGQLSTPKMLDRRTLKGLAG
jgi:hypothetical protein